MSDQTVSASSAGEPVDVEIQGGSNVAKNTLRTIDLVPLFSREVAAVVLWTLLADVLIFRTATYVGLALFTLATPLLYRIAATSSGASRTLGATRTHNDPPTPDDSPTPNDSLVPGAARPHPMAMAVCGALAGMVAIRLCWLGDPMTVAAAVLLIVAMAMAATGVRPLVLEGFAWIGRSFVDGLHRVRSWRITTHTRDTFRRHPAVGAVVLPMAAVVTFGTLFTLANPDLFEWTRGRLDSAYRWTIGRLQTLSIWEIPFCVAALVIGAGLMRPFRPGLRFGGSDRIETSAERASPMYAAYRNTLVSLVVLFAVYLGFEFRTLWHREFPQGFYYAGYAHQGAAWLTVALLVATVSLSVVFGRSLAHDPRRRRVERLAWLWSAENFLLAIAVYNRLMIYVGYNGMTRMRTVGFFGITLVVVGFALVVYKIARERSFWWLLRHQLLAFVLAGIVYAVWPTDYLTHRYNAVRVQSGYANPSVMIAVKPIDDEGMLNLFELIDHRDPIIREGVRARLATRATELLDDPNMSINGKTWPEYQGATRALIARFETVPWRSWFAHRVDRHRARTRFTDYAMRWY